MISWGLILWLIGLSVITFFGVMWLLDISNRQRQLQEKLEHTYVDGEGCDVSEPIRALTKRVEESESRVENLHAAVQQSRAEIGEFASQLPAVVLEASPLTSSRFVVGVRASPTKPASRTTVLL